MVRIAQVLVEGLGLGLFWMKDMQNRKEHYMERKNMPEEKRNHPQPQMYVHTTQFSAGARKFPPSFAFRISANWCEHIIGSGATESKKTNCPCPRVTRITNGDCLKFSQNVSPTFSHC